MGGGREEDPALKTDDGGVRVRFSSAVCVTVNVCASLFKIQDG